MSTENFVRSLIAQYGERGIDPTAINRGLCEEFAMTLVRQFKETGFLIDTANFMTPDHTGVDWPLVDKHWNGIRLNASQRQILERAIQRGHTWAMIEGRHYDAQVPQGVEFFYQLPFFGLSVS